MSRPVLQFTRLMSSGRLPDRFMACQIRDLLDAEGHARLFVIIEIVRPWLAASQIGQALLQAFLGGYHDAGSPAGLKRVEAGLKRVNETLVHLTQQGETEWVGHLHALIALEEGGTIHVAQTGRAGAVLVRDGSVSRVTELEGAQSAASANRTFGTITSGELTAGDALVIGSGDFFRSLSHELIADSLRETTAAEAIQRFVRILRQHQARAAAAIAIRAYDAGTLADQPLIAEPEVIYLDEPPIETLGGSLRSLGRRAGRLASTGGHQLTRAASWLRATFTTTIAPRSRALLAAGQQRTSEALTELRTKHLPNAIAATKPLLDRAGKVTKQAAMASIKHAKNLAVVSPAASTTEASAQAPLTAHRSPLTADSGLIGRTLYTIRHYTEAPPTAPSRRLFPPVRLEWPKLGWPRIDWLTGLFTPKHRPRLYAGLAAILFLILVMNLSLLQRHRQEQQQSAATAERVTELRRKFDDAKLSLALKRDASVAATLTSLLEQLQPLVSTPAVATDATTLQHEVQDTLDGLTNSTRIRDPKLIATFDQPVGLVRLGSSLVTAHATTSRLLTSPIAGELIDDRSTLPEGERTRTLVRLDQSDVVIALSTKPAAYRLTTPGDPPNRLELTGGSWETAVASASFGDNLYLLDPAGDQIWKHSVAADGKYGAGTKFVTDDTSVATGTSLAIDGSIYVLATDGPITKLTRGQRDSFTIKDLPPEISLANARMIWTDADTSSLFVLTKTSLVQLSKTGSYTRRYISDQFTDLSAFVVDPAAKQAWVLNGSTVYELNLTGA